MTPNNNLFPDHDKLCDECGFSVCIYDCSKHETCDYGCGSYVSVKGMICSGCIQADANDLANSGANL